MSTRLTCTRKLEFDAGHRLMEHGGKCSSMHGHRFTAELTLVPSPMRPGGDGALGGLDEQGMVVDFGIVKKLVGGWIDEHWDHGMVLDKDDTFWVAAFKNAGFKVYEMDGPPTAENMAKHLLLKAKHLLRPHGTEVLCVRLYETPNCWAEAYP